MQKQLKELWQRAAARRAKNIFYPYFSKAEKLRLKREFDIIEQTDAVGLIMSFVNQADEARKKGDFFVEGAANCSFLLYAVGATTLKPLWAGLPMDRLWEWSPFEIFINPLVDVKPEYKIVFAEKPAFTPEEEELRFDEIVIKRALEYGILSKEQQNYGNGLLPAVNYQFVNEVLADSKGKMIWIEQATELLSRMGGFTYAEADLMRRECDGSFSANDVRFSERRKKFLNHALQVGYGYNFADEYFYHIFKAFSNAKLLLKAHVAATVFGRNK